MTGFNFGAIVDNISAAVPKCESSYMGEDGMLHCSVCHRAVQTRVEFMGIEKVVNCACNCIRIEYEKAKERKRQEHRERLRRACFPETEMFNWTFENDDQKNPTISSAMMRYADQFKEFRRDSKGLLLYGTVGTGKTYYAACIANRLIDHGYSVLMTNFARLTNKIQGMYEGKQEFIDSLNDYTLLIIDDLGAERKSEFMQEMVFNIIDSRYRSQLPMIVTTNLTVDELKNPEDLARARIYDRILERCMAIKVNNQNIRELNQAAVLARAKQLLGST